MRATFLQGPRYSAPLNHRERLKSNTCANHQGCCNHQTAFSHGAEGRHSTKRGVLAPKHSVCKMQVTRGVRASTECDAVPKGAIPFYAFAH